MTGSITDTVLELLLATYSSFVERLESAIATGALPTGMSFRFVLLFVAITDTVSEPMLAT